jgi:hypothetical protein
MMQHEAVGGHLVASVGRGRGVTVLRAFGI